MFKKLGLSIVIFILFTLNSQAIEYKLFNVDKLQYIYAKVEAKNINLHWKDSDGIPFRNLTTLANALRNSNLKPLFLTNAGIFSKNMTPAGLFIENGVKIKSINNKNGQGNFHIKPNGVFLVTQDGIPQILTTDEYNLTYGQKESEIRIAVQSGPMLIIDNQINSNFSKDSNSFYIRNAVCLNKENDVFFIITDSNNVSFYQLALAASSLGCYQALYLDGSISKMYIAGFNTTFSFYNYVGIFSITESIDNRPSSALKVPEFSSNP